MNRERNEIRRSPVQPRTGPMNSGHSGPRQKGPPVLLGGMRPRKQRKENRLGSDVMNLMARPSRERTESPSAFANVGQARRTFGSQISRKAKKKRKEDASQEAEAKRRENEKISRALQYAETQEAETQEAEEEEDMNVDIMNLPTLEPSAQLSEEEEPNEDSEVYLGALDGEESTSEDETSSQVAQNKEKEKQTSAKKVSGAKLPKEGAVSTLSSSTDSSTVTTTTPNTQAMTPAVENGKEKSSHEEGSGEKRKRRSRKGLKEISSLRVHQRGCINAVRESLGYQDLQMSAGYRESLSAAVVLFGEKVLVACQTLLITSKKQQLKASFVKASIQAIVPYGPLRHRMETAMSEAADSSLANEECNEEDKIHGAQQKKCGLNISISAVHNLAARVIPCVGGIHSSAPFVVLAASMEVMMKEIINFSLGSIIAESLSSSSPNIVATPGGENEEEEGGKKKRTPKDNIPITMEGIPTGSAMSSKVRMTLTRHDLNVALHFETTPDMIKRYSSNQIYAHRRTSYQAELAKEEKKNAKRNPRMQRKRIAMKAVALKTATDANKKGLLLPEEIVSYMVHDNVLPLIFKDTQSLDTSTLVSVREDVLPDRLKKKARRYSEGTGVIQHPRSMLRTLQFMWGEFAESGDALSWIQRERA